MTVSSFHFRRTKKHIQLQKLYPALCHI